MHPGTHARKHPRKPAQIMAATGEVLTYGELDGRSNRFAQLLWNAGLRRGDGLAVFMENHPRFLELYWAAMRSGLYFTPINRFLTAEEAAYIVNDSAAKVLVSSAHLGDVTDELAGLTSGTRLQLMVDGIRDGYESYEAAVADQSPEPLDLQPMGGLLLYSSGTTGRPKGVWRPLPEKTIDENPQRLPPSGPLAIDDSAVYLSSAPLYHTAPLGFAAGVQRSGATVVVMEKFEPLQALRAIEAHRVTHSQWVPTMFVRMLRLPEEDRTGHDLSSHAVAIHGAGPCAPAVKRQMIEWWGPILVEHYGSTEGTGLTVIDSHEWLEHEGSVGRPVLGTVHICDRSGRELGHGEDGLVYFEHDKLPFKYLNDDAKTDAARHPLHRNWTTLGDIGHVDGDGYLYLTDREDFVIISGGVNIYPAESENVLLAHPSVMDVAVVGVPNEEFGEEVKAFVQPTDPIGDPAALEGELIAFCRDRLAHYKCPRTVEFVAALPRLPTGKLSKNRLGLPQPGGRGEESP
ncbi:acyl-CoA synthetase [Actinospongicola halichondriae]|uniref:acyl-CoA synthetase n=1 Tax=Actinospongicola halichondriae TaxID=3236844 RepID=UPI003D441363